MSFLTTLPRDRYSSEAFAEFNPQQAAFNLGTGTPETAVAYVE